MGAAASTNSPMSELGKAAQKIIKEDCDVKGKSAGHSGSGGLQAEIAYDETMLKVAEVKAMVKRLQDVRTEISTRSEQMSNSKVIERMVNEGADIEVEKREAGIFRVSRDRSKSMEEYPDGTTIRRIDGTVERTNADGSVEQISTDNEVTLRSAAGDIHVLAEHDTLLNQKLADGTQVQTNLETGVQIMINADGLRIEIDAKTKTKVTLHPDGKQVTLFEDKTELTVNTDGTSRQVSPDGTSVEIDKDGVKLQTNPDGSSVTVYPDGKKVRQLANGTVIESYASGVTRKFDVNSPNFGKRSAENQQVVTESKKTHHASTSSLPSLNGLPGVSRASTERFSDDDSDTDEYDITKRDGVRVGLSMASLVGALDAAIAHRKGAENGDGTVTRLKDLNGAQVIRLLEDWDMAIYVKSFATKNVNGQRLHDLSSMNDPLLDGAPSSVRKDFWYRLMHAKKNGLSKETLETILSPSFKLKRAMSMHLENNALDKSKLMWGADYDPDHIRQWIQKGAFIDWHNPDENGCTLLHMVAKAGRVEALNTLIELKADLNSMNNRKTTPLHLACRKGHEAIVKILLKAKANPKIRNKKGTPLDEARAQSKSAKIANLRANIVSAFGHVDQ